MEAEALEVIYRLAMTVRLIPENSDYDAAAEAIRAELGISPVAMRMQLRQQFDGDGGRA